MTSFYFYFEVSLLTFVHMHNHFKNIDRSIELYNATYRTRFMKSGLYSTVTWTTRYNRTRTTVEPLCHHDNGMTLSYA